MNGNRNLPLLGATLSQPRRVGRSLGRVLRHSSQGELTQPISVLFGQMSVVGPRPHVVGMQAGGTARNELGPDCELRTFVLPGLTG